MLSFFVTEKQNIAKSTILFNRKSGAICKNMKRPITVRANPYKPLHWHKLWKVKPSPDCGSSRNSIWSCFAGAENRFNSYDVLPFFSPISLNVTSLPRRVMKRWKRVALYNHFCYFAFSCSDFNEIHYFTQLNKFGSVKNICMSFLVVLTMFIKTLEINHYSYACEGQIFLCWRKIGL